jgi:hypothetical protein
MKNLVDALKIMFLFLFVDMVWLLCKSKEGDGFQGWHKDLALGKQITKAIVINLESKEKKDEETTRSFNNHVSFEADDLNAIEDHTLSEINLKHELSQDESKPAAIPHNSAILQEEIKNFDDIAEDERKPAAILQDEMISDDIAENKWKPAAILQEEISTIYTV